MASEVSAIVPGSNIPNLDVILHVRDGGLRCINAIHRPYDPLFYVMLFPYGDDGWQIGIKRSSGRILTATDLYSYRLQVRHSDFNLIMKIRRLMQRYAVDCWANIESSKLQWVENNQKTIRAEK